MKLETTQLIVSDKPDKDGDIEIEIIQSCEFVFLGEEEALKLARHILEVFKKD